MTRMLDQATWLAALKYDESAAQRDVALELVACLVALVSRECGYLAHEDQATLRRARALLEEASR